MIVKETPWKMKEQQYSDCNSCQPHRVQAHMQTVLIPTQNRLWTSVDPLHWNAHKSRQTMRPSIPSLPSTRRQHFDCVSWKQICLPYTDLKLQCPRSDKQSPHPKSLLRVRRLHFKWQDMHFFKMPYGFTILSQEVIHRCLKENYLRCMLVRHVKSVSSSRNVVEDNLMVHH